MFNWQWLTLGKASGSGTRRPAGKHSFRPLPLLGNPHVQTVLGTCWTGVALAEEAVTAAIVGIPIDTVTIGAITPVAYTKGIDFRPARRPAPEDVIHWDAW